MEVQADICQDRNDAFEQWWEDATISDKQFAPLDIRYVKVLFNLVFNLGWNACDRHWHMRQLEFIEPDSVPNYEEVIAAQESKRKKKRKK